ncbi:MAG: three-Cys-motif partner protein TcmP [Dehalococcoidales bacterium]|nr:three-Cys-motif partner protein TcmP [Dehalococcoidales bacterium]
MNEELAHVPRQISKWLCHKLLCFSDYINNYTQNNGSRCYIELFAGRGLYYCKKTDCSIDGTEIIALKDTFSRCIYIVNSPEEAKALNQITKQYEKINHVINGNCINDKVIREAFNLIPRSEAGFALVDPPGYKRLRWSVIKNLALHGLDWRGHKMDLLIIFPLEMALLRNLTRTDCETSINRLYGNTEWQHIRQELMDNSIEHDKAGKDLIALFKDGLKKLGYRYIDDTQPARFSNPPNYHIIWASDTSNKSKVINNVWNKPRYLPCELFANNVKE